MNDPLSQTDGSNDSKTPSLFFKDLGEALRALKALQPPFSDTVCVGFLDKVRASPASKAIAFGLLSQGGHMDGDARWNAVRSSTRRLLLGDREVPLEGRLADRKLRNQWLADEFAVELKTEAAKTFVADFGYLRPLYLILSAPDSESWIAEALVRYSDELEALLDMASGKAGNRFTPKQNWSPSESIAKIVSKQIPASASNPRGLRTHLMLIRALAALHERRAEELEQANHQVDVLDRLLRDEKEKCASSSQALSIATEKIAAAARAHQALETDLRASEGRLQMQKGLASATLADELNRQRAAMRSQLREKVQNIRLYSDREEPAREKILRLCDEVLNILDNNDKTTP